MSANREAMDDLIVEDPLEQELKLFHDRLLALKEPEDPNKPQARIYGLDPDGSVSHYISLENVRTISSQDSTGKKVRQNARGNSLVVQHDGIFYKNLVLGAKPFIERAVYEMNGLLGGGLVTPTRLLFIQPIAPHGSEQPECYALQASLEVPGIGLENLLDLPQALKILKDVLGEPQLKQNLFSLMEEEYFREWQKTRKEIQENNAATAFVSLSWEAELELLLKEIGDKQFDKQDLLGNQAILGCSPLKALALLKKYPELKSIPLKQLLPLPTLLSDLTILFPKAKDSKVTPGTILYEVENIINRFDQDNFTRHILLALLTEPSDHKADNFRVRVYHEAPGKLSLKIVAIDNDCAMEGVYSVSSRGEPLQHKPKVRTVLFGFPNILEAAFSKTFHESLLQLNPEAWVTHWLYKLGKYYLPYQTVVGKKECFLSLDLEKPFSQRFVLKFLNHLTSLKALVTSKKSEDARLTLGEIFLKLEPVLGKYCVALQIHCDGPRDFIEKLDSSEPGWSIEKLLTKEFEKGGALHEQKISAELKESQEIDSGGYVEVVTKFIKEQDFSKKLFRSDSMTFSGLLLFSLLYRFKIGINGVIPMSSISIKLFVQLYRTEPQDWIAWLKENGPMLCLQYKSKVGHTERLEITEVFKKPSSLFRLMTVSDRVDFLRYLFQAFTACGHDLNFVDAPSGYTPLQYTVQNNLKDVLIALVEAGADLEFQDVHGDTALDWAIQYQYATSAQDKKDDYEARIIQLINLGAGKRLKIQNGVRLIDNLFNTIRDACQRLLATNENLSWHFVIEHFTISVSPSTKNVRINRPVESGRVNTEPGRYLIPSVHKQLFQDGVTFRHGNVHGRSSVASVQEKIKDIEFALHFKKDSKHLNREIMTHCLAKQLFPDLTPKLSVWRFNQETTSFFGFSSNTEYPVLVSHTIEGVDLFNVLNLQPERLKHIDPKSFSEAIIFEMLRNNADGRADNYILQNCSTAHQPNYQLRCIDHEQSLSEPFIVDAQGQILEGPKNVQVRSILYCFDQMHTSIHPEVRKRILLMKPGDLLKAWLEDLRIERNKINSIFDESQRVNLKIKTGILLDIKMNLRFLERLYYKIIRIQKELRNPKNVNITHMSLLQKVMPRLAMYYVQAFSKHPTPLDRFNFLFEGCFETRELTPTEIKQIAEDMKLKKEELPISKISSTLSVADPIQLLEVPDAKRPKQNLYNDWEESLENALKRLTEIQDDKNLENIRKELEVGNVENFKKLSVSHKQLVFNGRGEKPGIDFAVMRKKSEEEAARADAEKQNTVLNAIKGLDLRVLRLHNCDVLTDDILQALLKPLHNLYSLEIVGCQSLTFEALSHIARLCPTLEKLRLVGLSSLGAMDNLNFPKLRFLVIKNCENMLGWAISLPNIERFYISNCSALSKIVGAHYHKLRVVEINNCKNLVHANFYKKFPQLLGLPIDNRNSEFVEKLEALCKKLFFAHGNPNSPLPQAFVNGLYNSLQDWENCLQKMAALAISMLKAPAASGQLTVSILKLLNKFPLTRDQQKIVFEVISSALNSKVLSERLVIAEGLEGTRFCVEFKKELENTLTPVIHHGNVDVKERALVILFKLAVIDSKIAEELIKQLAIRCITERPTGQNSLSNTNAFGQDICSILMRVMISIFRTLPTAAIESTSLIWSTLVKDNVIEDRLKDKFLESVMILLRDPNSRSSAIRLLVQCKPEFKEKVRDDLINFLKWPTQSDKELVFEVLDELSKDETFLSILISASFSILASQARKTDLLRVNVLEFLLRPIIRNKIVKRDFDYLVSIILCDPNEELRESFLQALDDDFISSYSKEIILVILPRLKNSTNSIFVLKVLEKIYSKTCLELVPKVVDAVTPLLQHVDSRIKLATIKVMCKYAKDQLGKTLIEILEILLGLLRNVNEDEKTRIEAAELLLQFPSIVRSLVLRELLPIFKRQILKDYETDEYCHIKNILILLSVHSEILKEMIDEISPFLQAKNNITKLRTVQFLLKLNPSRELIEGCVQALLVLFWEKEKIEQVSVYFKQLILNNNSSSITCQKLIELMYDKRSNLRENAETIFRKFLFDSSTQKIFLKDSLTEYWKFTWEHLILLAKALKNNIEDPTSADNLTSRALYLDSGFYSISFKAGESGGNLQNPELVLKRLPDVVHFALTDNSRYQVLQRVTVCLDQKDPRILNAALAVLEKVSDSISDYYLERILKKLTDLLSGNGSFFTRKLGIQVLTRLLPRLKNPEDWLKRIFLLHKKEEELPHEITEFLVAYCNLFPKSAEDIVRLIIRKIHSHFSSDLETAEMYSEYSRLLIIQLPALKKLSVHAGSIETVLNHIFTYISIENSRHIEYQGNIIDLVDIISSLICNLFVLDQDAAVKILTSYKLQSTSVIGPIIDNIFSRFLSLPSLEKCINVLHKLWNSNADIQSKIMSIFAKTASSEFFCSGFESLFRQNPSLLLPGNQALECPQAEGSTAGTNPDTKERKETQEQALLFSNGRQTPKPASKNKTSRKPQDFDLDAWMAFDYLDKSLGRK